MRNLAVLAFLGSCTAIAGAETPIALDVPIRCTVGQNCFIQRYVDVDPGPGLKDYRCGTAVGDGHKGVDFRLVSLAAAAKGVDVLASADGRVKGFRDGMADRLVRGKEEVEKLKGRDCGNGVVLDHGHGWETQYCHLRRGSVTVVKGQSVARGDVLGQVGASGRSGFAHVHLSVRHKGKIIDPFLGKAIDGTCRAKAEPENAGLWTAKAHGVLVYQGTQFIEAGFASGPLSTVSAERGAVAPALPRAPALVFYARAINMQSGDRLRLKAVGPGGFRAVSQTKAVDRRKPHYVAFSGKKLKSERWPAGLYKGEAELIRDGRSVARISRELTLR